MGRKVHPMGFRIGVIRDWQSKWYDDKHYAAFILEDAKLRKAVQSKYGEAGIAQVDIERQANKIAVTIHTSRPGIVIGRGGQRVEEMRQFLENTIDGKKIQLDIREIRQPELDAYLVARTVAEQMERRVAYRRAMKQAIFRTMQSGAKGMRILCSGRLGGVEIARRQLMHQGRVPLQTLRADVDYGFTEAHTTMGRIGVKVWIYRGDVFPTVETSEEATEGVAAMTTVLKDAAMAEALSKMNETQSDTSANSVTKKPRTRKKAEEVAKTETDEKPKAKQQIVGTTEESKKASKPRTKKSETSVVDTAESHEKKTTRAKVAKTAEKATKETKAKVKKGE